MDAFHITHILLSNCRSVPEKVTTMVEKSFFHTVCLTNLTQNPPHVHLVTFQQILSVIFINVTAPKLFVQYNHHRSVIQEILSISKINFFAVHHEVLKLGPLLTP